MERFLLDLEYLPKSKFLVIDQVSKEMMPEGKLNLIKGLIYLGFSTVRQEDINFASGNIGKMRTSGEHKLRIQLTNPALENFLNKQSVKKVKRTFIYALLYAGINSFVEFQGRLITEDISKRELEKIEKLLFLSGLSSFFDENIKITVGSVSIENRGNTDKIKPTLPIEKTKNEVNAKKVKDEDTHTDEISHTTGYENLNKSEQPQKNNVAVSNVEIDELEPKENTNNEQPVQAFQWREHFKNVDAG